MQERKELLEATARVRKFAEAHGIAVTMEHLNSGIDNGNIQLRLF